MDSNIMGNGIGNVEKEIKSIKQKKVKIKNENSDESTISRVVISKEADEALKILLNKVRNGYDGGHVDRSDIVNWVLLNHEKLVSDSDIRTIRSVYFDEMLALNKLVKLANQDGGLSEELKAQFKSLLNGASKKIKD